MRGIVTWLHIIPRNRRLNNRLQRGAHCDGAPRGRTRQSEGRLNGAVAAILLWHWELDRIETVALHVREARSTVAGIHTRLRHQRPSISDVEEAGEGVAMSVSATLVHRLIIAITLFIAGFRTLPTNHGIRLRGQERRGLTGEVEASSLLHDADGELLLIATTGMVGDCITEGHIIVADTEIHIIRIALCILQGHHQLVGIHMHLAELRTRHLVVERQVLFLLAVEGDALRKVAIVGYKAQRTLVKHLLVVVLHFIHGLATLYIYIHFEASIWTCHTCHLCRHAQRCQHCGQE